MTPPEWEAAWSAALAELEVDVDRAEQLLAAARTGMVAELNFPGRVWVAPVLEGPVPESLRARAQAVLERQLRAAEELSRSIATARRDLAVARRMSDAAVDRSAPAFLDAAL
jgi:hypothetical protein